MNTSERIKIIQEIARCLSSEEWTIIDLTLSQFGFPIKDDWNNSNRHDYIVTMIQNGEDDKLLALFEHFRLKHAAIDNPSFWGKGYFKLFLSHISSHKKEASKLQTILNNYAISAFVAHEDIEPAKEWLTEIEIALQTMHALVAIITSDFHSSRWTDQEVGFALGRNILVIPIKYEIDPYGFMAKHQAIKANIKDLQQLANDVFHVLLKNSRTKNFMLEALIYKFVNSISFLDAMANMALLEEVDKIPKSYFDSLKKAAKNNRQIRDAIGVPNRLEQILKRLDGA
jgi:hypothetical protein